MKTAENETVRRVLVVLAHTLFWVISFYLISNFVGFEEIQIEEIGDERFVSTEFNVDGIIQLILSLPFKMALFYSIALYFFPKAINGKKILSFLLKTTGTTVGVLVVELVVVKVILFREMAFETIFNFPFLAANILPIDSFIYLYFVVSAVVYAFIREWIKNEQIRRNLTEEKLQTELNFLKSQINPHFLFNTLNNLYSIAEKHEVKELSKGITELASLMRYMLYESNVDEVPLQRELSYLESYIEIEQLRISEDDDIMVNLKTEGDIERVKIAPVLLIPFVENAFKHGINLKERSIIDIRLSVKNDKLYFLVKNKIFRLRENSHGSNGIGLHNVQRRLELLYPDRHELTTSAEDGYFTVYLNLNLK